MNHTGLLTLCLSICKALFVHKQDVTCLVVLGGVNGSQVVPIQAKKNAMVFSSGEKCLRKRYKSVKRLKFAFFSRLSHHRYMHAIKYDGCESRQLYISYTSFFSLLWN